MNHMDTEITAMPSLTTLESAPPAAHGAGQAKVDAREYRLFRALDTNNTGTVTPAELIASLEAVGLEKHDPRLTGMVAELDALPASEGLTFERFSESVRPNILLVERALQGNLVIPDFKEFCTALTQIFEETRENRDGKVADYIPQLARVEAEQFAVAVCTVDGQRFSLGDATVDFSVQSCCKPLNYCLALEEQGDEEVHRYVGREPSGLNFNELALNREGKPHNPMINSGAIMTSSLVKPALDNADRFDYVLDRWAAMTGGRPARFNNAIYQSERVTADRNFALGYYMKENKAFPENTDLLKTLDFYFQCCAVEASTEQMAGLASTLANGGVCPTSGERVLKTRSVQHCLSLMCSCGMYDYSGEFSFTVGLPAKSGVGGGIMISIPNVVGICVWSPRLDAHGNSARGIEFARRLVEAFNLHNFDALALESEKTDPRVSRIESVAERLGEMIWAASKGDVGAIHRLSVRGYDANDADYDGRTPLHLAAAEGQLDAVKYLLDSGAALNPQDRWGGTPLDDARRQGHAPVASMLEDLGADQGFAHISRSASPATCSNGTAFDLQEDRIVELIYAASEGNLDAVRRMVARGICLSGADYDLRTPLHLAAAEGHSDLVQYFIDHQVPLTPTDRWGNTPLDEARRHGHEDVVDRLEKESGRWSENNELVHFETKVNGKETTVEAVSHSA